MTSLGCGTDCAPLSWEALAPHAIWGGVVWAVLLLHGIALVCFAFANHVDKFFAQMTNLRMRLHGSFVYTMLCFLLSITQCVLYCMRTHTKTMYDWEVIIELVAASLYLFDFVISWVYAWLSGFGRGFLFMFSGGLLDSLLIPSAFCIFLFTDSNGDKSWASFSFLAALHSGICWHRLLEIRRVNLKVLKWQLADVVCSSVCMVLFSAMAIMTLENLGDPEVLRPYNDEKWSVISSLYFVFVSISTVGYGDLAPMSTLGRIFVVAFIFGGVSWLLLAVGNVVQAINLQASGGGYYEPVGRTKHVIITGNPTVTMAKDFIAELFNTDHGEDADDLVAIFLFQRTHPATPSAIQALSLHLKDRSMVRIARQVYVFQGNVLDQQDLDRVSIGRAAGVFVLPNSNCEDPLTEDTENIIRMMAMQRATPASTHLILLLMKSENQRLLDEAGMTGLDLSCLALDQFKMEIMGKSSQVPGFSTFICNLCKSMQGDEDNAATKFEDPLDDQRQVWQQEYDHGMGQELYEVELSHTYAAKQATFGEVVLDVLQQTGGTVYTLGIVEVRVDGTKTVLINPGINYEIKQVASGVNTLGIFIASDRDAVVQCEGGMVFLGRRERPRESMDEAALRAAAVPTRDAREQAMMEDLRLNEQLLGWLDKHQTERAKQLVSLVKRHHIAAAPSRPPLKLLAKGGHVLLCCVGATSQEDLALGLDHFIWPLRTVPKGAPLVPIVVLCATVPSDWHSIVDYADVYFLRGSPGQLFDLERACFKGASTIAICNVSANRLSNKNPEPWMVDSEVVCCTRLVESQLGGASTTQVITELSAGSNHSFLPMPKDLEDLIAGSLEERPKPSLKRGSTASRRRRFSLASMGSVSSLFSTPQVRGGSNLFARTFSLRSDASVNMGSSSDEYYRQQRYACGQLFVGTIVTSLVVNTYYNPTLCEMITAMIGTHTTMVRVPKAWVGKSYFEFFDYLLYTEGYMAIGIFRSVARRATNQRATPSTATSDPRNAMDFDVSWMQSINASRMTSYMYTAPPGKETTMLQSDRVVCFGVSAPMLK